MASMQCLKEFINKYATVIGYIVKKKKKKKEYLHIEEINLEYLKDHQSCCNTIFGSFVQLSNHLERKTHC